MGAENILVWSCTVQRDCVGFEFKVRGRLSAAPVSLSRTNQRSEPTVADFLAALVPLGTNGFTFLGVVRWLQTVIQAMSFYMRSRSHLV
jgi:hypothetical protein